MDSAYVLCGRALSACVGPGGIPESVEGSQVAVASAARPRRGQAVQAGVAYDRHPLVVSGDLYSGRLGRRPAAQVRVGPDKIVVCYEPGNGGGARHLDAAEDLLTLPEGAVEPLLNVVVLLAPQARLAYVPALLARVVCGKYPVKRATVGRQVVRHKHPGSLAGPGLCGCQQALRVVPILPVAHVVRQAESG